MLQDVGIEEWQKRLSLCFGSCGKMEDLYLCLVYRLNYPCQGARWDLLKVSKLEEICLSQRTSIKISQSQIRYRNAKST